MLLQRYVKSKTIQKKHRVFFIVEMQRSLSKGTVKIRLSEENEKYFSLLSVRILFKSNTIQKNKHFFVIQPIKRCTRQRRPTP